MTREQLINVTSRLMAGHWANGYYPTFGDVATDALKLIQTCEWVHKNPESAKDKSDMSRAALRLIQETNHVRE